MTLLPPDSLADRLQSGLLSFPVTHFDADLQVDEARYREHLAWQASFDVAGLFAAGGTGEGFSMTSEEIDRVVRIFRELRAGVTEDGRQSLKSPSGTLSTAEAISVVTSGLAMAGHFGDGCLRAPDVAAGVVGAVVKDPVQDQVVWLEYLETVVKERDGWKDLYRACREVS